MWLPDTPFPKPGEIRLPGVGEAHPFVFKELMILIPWRVGAGEMVTRSINIRLHTR